MMFFDVLQDLIHGIAPIDVQTDDVVMERLPVDRHFCAYKSNLGSLGKCDKAVAKQEVAESIKFGFL